MTEEMHVIITMAGHSRRFNAAGYDGPKWLLPVGDKTMIEHVIDMFGPQDNFHFVINQSQADQYPRQVDWLAALTANGEVCVVPAHEEGPTWSALQVKGIRDNARVIVTYCDFTVRWDYPRFLRHAHGSAGAVVSFRGFHPASFGTTYYAYMRSEGNRMLELREKQSFTDNRAEEPASTGIYYFCDFATFRHYGEKLLAAGDMELPEAYVSLLFNPMVEDGLQITLHDVENFICLGTPEDYEQYQFWHRYFSSEQPVADAVDTSVRRINLLPMAGSGSRFREFGYRVAKPLIQIHGEPMMLRALRSLPYATDWLFLPRAEDLERHPIERAVQSFTANSQFFPVRELTSGQAATCLLAEKALEPQDELIIASCDYEHRYDPTAWQAILDDLHIDGAVWTCRMGSGLTKNPNAFAYCQVGEDGRSIVEIVEKKTISDSPEQDPLVVGTFWYRRAGDFVRGARSMMEKEITVNGEHYVGTSINQLLGEGARFVIFDVEQWISFGDPFELQVLEYWQEFFSDSKAL
jgi:NDP-sugar pyrophosphorylase family protein